jgi:hypothetical protein
LTAASGNDVWLLAPSGQLTHIYLGDHTNPSCLAYDSRNGDMYVCGYSGYYSNDALYVIG